jgi:hypothetical protein
MFNLLNKTRLFKFGAFAARSQGMGQVAPVVTHREGNVERFGRFGRHR